MEKIFTFISLFVISIALLFGVEHRMNANQYVDQVISPLSTKPYNTPTPSSTPTPSLIPTPTVTLTPTITPTPMPIVASADLDRLFIQYSSQYSVSTELLKRIAKCESGFNPNSNSHGYGGLFQFSESLWVQTRNLIGLNADPNLRFNAEESIKTAAFMLSQNHLGIWPNCNK